MRKRKVILLGALGCAVVAVSMAASLWVYHEIRTARGLFTIGSSVFGEYSMSCQCVEDHFGTVRTVVCTYVESGGLPKNEVTSSFETNGIGNRASVLIDGSAVPMEAFSFWFISDTVPATKVPLTTAERRRIQFAVKNRTDDVVPFIRQVILPKFSPSSQPASAASGPAS